MKTWYFRLATLFFIGLVASSVFAYNVDSTAINASDHNEIASKNTDKKSNVNHQYSVQKAKLWNISVEEWDRYETYMSNEGKYYYGNLNLSPLEVLAVTASSDDEMRKFTDIWVKKNHEKLARELAFNVMYRDEYQRLYPNEKPLKPLNKTAYAPQSGSPSTENLQSGDILIAFVNEKSLFSHGLIKGLTRLIEKTPQTKLVIYVVGNHLTSQKLQAWALTQGVSSTLLQSGSVRVTDGTTKYHEKSSNKALPLVFLQRAGNINQITNFSELS